MDREKEKDEKVIEMKINRLHLDLANECNLNCVYCYVDRNAIAGINMNTSDWLEVISQAEEMGIRNFIISGGEPLIFPGFLEILDKIESIQAQVVLMTNLTDVSKKNLDALINSPSIQEIITSLDGFDKGHNIARPPSDWKKVIKNITRIKKEKSGCKLCINTVLHKLNAEEMIRLHETITTLGIDVWRVDFPIKPKDPNVLCSFSEATNILAEIIKDRYIHPELQRTQIALFRIYKSQLENISIDVAMSQSNVSLHPCQYFFGTLAIKPNRAITICSPMKLVLSWLDSTNNLEVALKQAEGNEFFNLRVNDIQDCKDCRYILLCESGCRADALLWTDDLMNADPISCSMMPLVEKNIIPVLSKNLREIYTSLINTNGRPPRYKIVYADELYTLQRFL